MQYCIVVDQNLCIGCHACEVACKQENDLLSGRSWIRVVQVGPRKIGGELRLDFIPIMCKHCGKPPCMDVCPTKAILKRPEDGIVLINSDLCTGCMACIEACPFGVLSFNNDEKIMQKCTLCVHRVKRGLQPSCAQHCLTKAIHFGDINKISKQICEEHVLRTISI
jgi:Fe-S-cluster-containing dehydrogenase component